MKALVAFEDEKEIVRQLDLSHHVMPSVTSYYIKKSFTRWQVDAGPMPLDFLSLKLPDRYALFCIGCLDSSVSLSYVYLNDLTHFLPVPCCPIPDLHHPPEQRLWGCLERILFPQKFSNFISSFLQTPHS